MALYAYGMRLRGFSLGCQPKQGFMQVEDGNDSYYNIVIYNRKLTEDELEQYELDYLGVQVE